MQATAQFNGSIPALYDTMLGPFLFDWSAESLADRVKVPAKGTVLEIACGTGIATEALRRELPLDVSIVATDVNEAMLAEGAKRRPDLVNVSTAVANAQTLPFDSESFDAVVCQFGLMFFPDRVEALREALRVTKPGGRLLFSVWDSLAANPPVEVVHETIRSFFPEDPPRFLETPFGFYVPKEIIQLFERAGARHVRVEAVEHEVELPSGRAPAVGLIRGNPGALEISERNGSLEDIIVNTAEAALEARFGEAPFRAPLRALFVSARK
jgi:ubiquinone/menaquinone biosynthesis C-methylase UbiE